MIHLKKFLPNWQLVRLYFIIFSFIGLPLLITTINQERDTRQHAALSGSKLGVYVYGSCQEAKKILEAGPRIAKFHNGQDYMDMVRAYKNAHPDGIAVLRIGRPASYPESTPPDAAAQDFVNNIIKPEFDKIPDNEKWMIDYISGTNEYDSHVSLNQNVDWVSKFWAATAAEIKSQTGKKPLIGEIPVGNLDTGPQVDTVANNLQSVNGIGGALSYHAYGGVSAGNTPGGYPPGMDGNVEQWTSLRYRKFYAQRNDLPPLILGEAGIDGNKPEQGWFAQSGQVEYKQWLTWFDNQIKQDSYVLGASIFQVCNNDTAWRTYNITPITDWLVSYLQGSAGSIPPGSGTTPGAAIPPGQVPLGNCNTNTNTNYTSLNIIPNPRFPPPHPDRPSDDPMYGRAIQHADYNLIPSLRGWQTVNQPKQLISTGRASNVDPKAPRLSTLLTRTSSISATYQVNNWNWPQDLKLPGTRSSPIISPPVTMIGLKTTPGDVIRFPVSGYQVDAQGQGGFVLYASISNITLKYTREDNIVDGYTIHVDGISVNRNLINTYTLNNNANRNNLPAIFPCQVIGTALGNEVRVSIRDKGSFLDPRWAEDWWGTAVTNPTPTTGSPSNNPQPTATPVAWINISIKDEAGNPVNPSSGEIYVERVDAQTGTRISSDNQTLGQANEENFIYQSPGVYKYNVKSSYLRYKFYAGLQPPAVINGFTVIDPGSTMVNGQPVKTRREDNGTPFTLATDQTKDINIIIRNNTGGAPTSAVTQQPTAIPAQTLNCWEIQGPDQIVVGDKATYITKYSAPNGAALSGSLNAVKADNLNPKRSVGWDWSSGRPQTINANSGILSFDWTPQSEGEYTLFCSAFSLNITECRGASSTVEAPQSLCVGPGAWKTVKVISRTGASGPDMCSSSQILGHQVLTPQQTPVTIVANEMTEFNVSNYTFSFLNVENNNKPVQFAAGTPYVITKNKPNNSVTIQYSDMDRSDYNNNGQKPKQIKIQANFTADGVFSSSSAACAQTITIANPTNTPIPSPLPTQSGTPAPINIITIIAAAGVLIIIIIIGAFFLH